jgi:hypothetical protein
MNRAKLNKLAVKLMSPDPNMRNFYSKNHNMTKTQYNAKVKELFNYEGRWNRAVAKARKIVENRIKQGKPAFSPSPPRPHAPARRGAGAPSKEKSKLQKLREKMKKKPSPQRHAHNSPRVAAAPKPPKINSKNLNAAAARLRQMAAHMKATRPKIVVLN